MVPLVLVSSSVKLVFVSNLCHSHIVSKIYFLRIYHFLNFHLDLLCDDLLFCSLGEDSR